MHIRVRADMVRLEATALADAGYLKSRRYNRLDFEARELEKKVGIPYRLSLRTSDPCDDWSDRTEKLPPLKSETGP